MSGSACFNFALYLREDHPLDKIERALKPGDFDDCEIANLTIPDWSTRVSQMESALKARGSRTRSGFRSDLPGAITQAVRCSDMVYPASSNVDTGQMPGLGKLEVEVDSEIMRYTINAHYHQRNRRNPVTLWLVECIRHLLA